MNNEETVSKDYINIEGEEPQLCTIVSKKERYCVIMIKDKIEIEGYAFEGLKALTKELEKQKQEKIRQKTDVAKELSYLEYRLKKIEEQKFDYSLKENSTTNKQNKDKTLQKDKDEALQKKGLDEQFRNLPQQIEDKTKSYEKLEK